MVSTLLVCANKSNCPTAPPNLSLVDFVDDQDDHLGGFAVTAGFGIDPYVQAFEADHDDYSSIMLKALADRLAEAFAEYAHHQLRTELWGYAADEALDNDALIREEYTGIRPTGELPALIIAKEALLDAVGRRSELGHSTHRIHGHVANRFGQRLLFCTSRCSLFPTSGKLTGSNR